MFENEHNLALHAWRAAHHASATAQAWYDALWQAYVDEDYRLHENNNGLIITSVFDATAVAYRARPLEQIDFGFQVPQYSIQLDDPEDDPLHNYYQAYLKEKEAWSLYQAAYHSLALVFFHNLHRYYTWCESTGKPEPVRNDNKFIAFNAGKVRVLEVKPAK